MWSLLFEKKTTKEGVKFSVIILFVFKMSQIVDKRCQKPSSLI